MYIAVNVADKGNHSESDEKSQVNSKGIAQTNVIEREYTNTHRYIYLQIYIDIYTERERERQTERERHTHTHTDRQTYLFVELFILLTKQTQES